jgi:hypothetical protein
MIFAQHRFDGLGFARSAAIYVARWRVAEERIAG